jgi:hypothetical protein
MQPLAQFQIELIDDAHDGGRRRRTQRFLDRPQRVVAMRGLDHDQTRGIKAKTAQSVPGGPAVFAKAVSGEDQKERAPRRQPSQQRGDEAEGGRHGLRFRHHLMQGAAGEPAFRQMGIDCPNPEGEGFVAMAETLDPGNEPA